MKNPARHSGEGGDSVRLAPSWLSGVAAFAGMTLLLSACAVGPDYAPPDAGAPQGWVSAHAHADDKAAIEQEWWRRFNDPVLDGLIAKALAGNLDLQMAQARIVQARAVRAGARSGLWPTVNATGSDERQANRIAFPGSGPSPFDLSKPFDVYQAGFDASWEIDLWGGKRREVEADTATLQAQEASRDDLRVSLLAEVARTYVEIRQYQAQLTIARDTVKADDDTVRIARDRFRSGNAPELDLMQARAQLEQARAQIPYYQNMLEQSGFAMDVLLGERPGVAHGLTQESKPIPAAGKDIALAAPAAVIAARPDIRMAERQLAAATAQQGVAAAQFFPKLSLTGFFGLLNTSYGNLFMAGSKSWDVSGGVLLPILNLGALSASLDAANARQQEALAGYRKTVIAALSDVECSLTAYDKQREFRAALAKSAADERRAAAIARQRYRDGLSSFLDVLEAQRTLYGIESQLAAADSQAAQDQIALYKSLGGGWQDASAPTEKPNDAAEGGLRL